MTMKKESPARGEANIIGGLVTFDNSKNTQKTQRFYWCSKSHSVEPFSLVGGEVSS